MPIVRPQLRRAAASATSRRDDREVGVASACRYNWPQMDALKNKLRPSRFPGMSPFMAAIVGYVFAESFTEPEIAELTVSESENLVYIRKAGAVGFDGIESLDDLRENWNRLLDAADLTLEERKEAVRLFVAKVVSL